MTSGSSLEYHTVWYHVILCLMRVTSAAHGSHISVRGECWIQPLPDEAVGAGLGKGHGWLWDFLSGFAVTRSKIHQCQVHRLFKCSCCPWTQLRNGSQLNSDCVFVLSSVVGDVKCYLAKKRWGCLTWSILGALEISVCLPFLFVSLWFWGI